jgi:Zinc finger, C2H2 type
MRGNAGDSGDRTGPLRRGSTAINKTATPSRKPKTAKVFVCPHCPTGTTFRWKGNLKRHHQLIHLQAKPYKCDICNESFGTKSNREVHMIVHLPEKRDLAGSRGANAVMSQVNHPQANPNGMQSQPTQGMPGSVPHIPGMQGMGGIPNMHSMAMGGVQGQVPHPGHPLAEHQYER